MTTNLRVSLTRGVRYRSHRAHNLAPQALIVVSARSARESNGKKNGRGIPSSATST
jgi:hypothetical protein